MDPQTSICHVKLQKLDVYTRYRYSRDKGNMYLLYSQII